MKFILHINDVVDDRPAGTIQPSDSDDSTAFDGWVELLRALENLSSRHNDQTEDPS